MSVEEHSRLMLGIRLAQTSFAGAALPALRSIVERHLGERAAARFEMAIKANSTFSRPDTYCQDRLHLEIDHLPDLIAEISVS